MKEEAVLRRSLTMFQVVFLGLAWMTPMIYFSVYGIAFENSHGMMTQAYLLAFVAIFFTAFSYGTMARKYPTSGSAYAYAKQAIHPYLGFLVGWALLLDYLFSPIIACLTFGIYLHAQFPSIPAYIWIVTLNIVLAVVNIIGIKFSANLSKLFVLIQIGFIAVFCSVLVYKLTAGGQPVHPVFTGDVPLSVILAGASIICFSFLGFDSITTMSEETVRSEKTIPRAIMIIVFTAIVLYIGPSVLVQMTYPGLTFDNADTAGFDLVKTIGGAGLSSLFITVLIMAIFTQGLSSVVSVSRLLFVMGRDSVLPKRCFGYVHPKFNTPTNNIIIVSAASLLALVIDLELAVKFVSFGALSAFICVNLSVIAQCYIKDKQRSTIQTVKYLIFPLIGACFIGWLLSLMEHDALVMGLVWLVLGIVYHLYRTKWSPAGREAKAPDWNRPTSV